MVSPKLQQHTSRGLQGPPGVAWPVGAEAKQAHHSQILSVQIVSTELLWETKNTDF